jgi:hypothetical protein
MISDLFLEQLKIWANDLRAVADQRPETGAGTLASAIELWMWTLNHLQNNTDADGSRLYHSNRQGVTFPLADALCWLLASRSQILDVLELAAKGPGNPTLAEGLPGTLAFLTDLCHVQAAHAAGESARICAELVFGYYRHPKNAEGCQACFAKEAPEKFVPGLEPFLRLRMKLDTCLAGCRLAKDRAGEALTKVMIPEALDYPQ